MEEAFGETAEESKACQVGQVKLSCAILGQNTLHKASASESLSTSPSFALHPVRANEGRVGRGERLRLTPFH